MVTRIDSVFQLSNDERFSYLCNLMNTFRCSYVCLWSLDHHTYFLVCKEGYYQGEDISQFVASSSSGSVARRLFDSYKNSTFNTIGMNDFVPGLAFKQRIPYLELQVPNLHTLAALELQRQFYQEASIKVAIFLGCDSGEIELGMSYIPQMNMKMQMQTLFPQDFSTRRQPSSMMELENIPFPTPESTDAALTRAYLAVLSSTPITPTTSSALQMSDLHHGYGQVRPRSSAFSSYLRGLGGISASHTRPRELIRRQSTFRRTLAFYRGLNNRRLQEQALQGTRATSNQLHHMISERRRREKINESFQALRSLLPPGTKKDKASVLRTTKEYVKSLKQEVVELTKRNKFLEEQLLPNKETTKTKQVPESPAHQERLNVSITPVSESTSGDQRLVDMEVIIMRGAVDRSTELLVRVLQFLTQVREQVSLVSMDAQNHDQHGATIWATFRLRIEGNEWDEYAFKEAIRRILAEFAL